MYGSKFPATYQDRSELIRVVDKMCLASSRFSRMPILFDYIFLSSNRIEILLVLPENESHQRKLVYSLADSVGFTHKTNDENVVIL
jgi:hypothetical protein